MDLALPRPHRRMVSSRTHAVATIACAGWLCAACTHTEDVVGLGPGQDGSLGGAGGANDPPPNTAGAPPLDLAPSWGTFTTPVPIPALDLEGVEDDDPSVTADRLELYFDSNRPGSSGGGDIWVSRRSRSDEPWGPPEPLVDVNSENEETTPSISADGLVLHFASNRAGGSGLRDVWVTSRSSREEPWSTPVNVEEINSEIIDGAPHVDASGLRLVFTRFVEGAGDELFAAQRATPSDPWSEPQPITEINGPGKQGEGQWLLEGRLLVWTGRDAETDTTSFYWAGRASEDVPLAPGGQLTGLNSEHNDTDSFFVPDRSYVVFASDRDGRMQIYESFHEP